MSDQSSHVWSYMPSYDFTSLSPTDFELLVRDLLEADRGWRLEAFSEGPDKGIDLRGSDQAGQIVIQCKHYAGSSFSDLRRSAIREKAKVDRLAPATYVFATSQDLSLTQRDQLIEALRPWLPDGISLLARADLNRLLALYPHVERQHFKLWLASVEMIETIVRNATWQRSAALLEDIQDRVRLYVRTPAFDTASEMLDTRSAVVLTGPPGVGKSMLADMLALAHWHAGWTVVSVSEDIDEAWTAYRSEARQLFIYDDFLGQTDLAERRSKNEGTRIARFLDRVRRATDKRLVMTTRRQLLHQAQQRDEVLGRADLAFYECLVSLDDYGIAERAAILYNHLYFSDLPRRVLSEYAAERSYWDVIRHANYAPRIVDLVVRRPHQSAAQLRDQLKVALDRPADLWGPAFANSLPPVAQRIVLTLLLFPIHGASPEALRRASIGTATAIEYTQALKALEGTWIRIRTHPDGSPAAISLADPSCRDFTLTFLDAEPTYGVDLIMSAVTASNAFSLLRYVGASKDSAAKYPRLAAALQDRGVGRYIYGLLTAQADLMETGDAGTSHEAFRETLDSADGYVDFLPAEAAGWLEQQRERYCFDISSEALFEDATDHVYAATEKYLSHPESFDGQRLVDMLDTWAWLLINEDCVPELHLYCVKHAPALAHLIDMRAFFARSVLALIRHELDDMTADLDAGQDAYDQLDRLEKLAADYHLTWNVEDQISSLRDEVAQQIANGYLPRLPRPQPRAAMPEDLYQRSRLVWAAVDVMFGQFELDYWTDAAG